MSDLLSVAFRLFGPRATLTAGADSILDIDPEKTASGSAVFVLSMEAFYYLLKGDTTAPDGDQVVATGRGTAYPARWRKIIGGGSAGLITVPTIEALRGLAVLSAAVLVDAWSVPGDGGGGIFNFIADLTTADDDGVIIRPNSIAPGDPGRFKRQYAGAVSVLWFGAKADGSNADDTPFIQQAIDSYLDIKMPGDSDFNIATTISLRTGLTLVGGGTTTRLHATAATAMEHTTDPSAAVNSVYRDFMILAEEGNEIGILCENSYRTSIERVYIDGDDGGLTTAGIRFVNSGAFNVANCLVSECHIRNGSGDGIQFYRADVGAGCAGMQIFSTRVQAMGGYAFDGAVGQVDTLSEVIIGGATVFEGCGGGVRGSFIYVGLDGIHFEQSAGVPLLEDAFVAIRGLRRFRSFYIGNCRFSGVNADYSINIGDPSPGGTTIGRNLVIEHNDFQNAVLGSLRIRHCVGVTVGPNFNNTFYEWEHNEGIRLHSEEGVLSNVPTPHQTAVSYAIDALEDEEIVVTLPGQTITLPLIRSFSRDGGKSYRIWNDFSAGDGVTTIVVDPENEDTIQGATSFILRGNLSAVEMLGTVPVGAPPNRWEAFLLQRDPVTVSIAVPALAAGALGHVDTVLAGALASLPINTPILVTPQADLAADGAGNGFLAYWRISASGTLRTYFVGTLAGGATNFTLRLI